MLPSALFGALAPPVPKELYEGIKPPIGLVKQLPGAHVVVDVVDGKASIVLPDYYKFLNKNTQIWVTPEEGFGIAYGKIDENEEIVTIFANSDMKFNVLIIGTRKDKDAVQNWNGIEILKNK